LQDLIFCQAMYGHIVHPLCEEIVISFCNIIRN